MLCGAAVGPFSGGEPEGMFIIASRSASDLTARHHSPAKEGTSLVNVLRSGVFRKLPRSLGNRRSAG